MQPNSQQSFLVWQGLLFEVGLTTIGASRKEFECNFIHHRDS
jgi:hypothetical protein